MRHIGCITLLSLLLIGSVAAHDGKERKLVSRQDPQYPELAKKMNLHGSVKIKLWISPQGSVRRSEYIGGHPLLAQAAIESLKEWRYEPVPRETTTVVEVRF
jgi:TonB family protein